MAINDIGTDPFTDFGKTTEQPLRVALGAAFVMNRTRFLVLPLIISVCLLSAGCANAGSDDDQASVSIETMRYRDSHYDETDNQGSVVDIHVPDGLDDPATIVLLHGYSSSPGSPDTPLKRFAPEVARLGAVVFEFFWQSSGITSDSVADLSCIGPFVKAHASTYGADPDNVIIVGHSMGGNTGSMLALSSFSLDPADDCAESGPSPEPIAFLGMGGSYGAIARPLDDDRTSFEVQLYPPDPKDPTIDLAADAEVAPGLTALDAFGLDGYSAIPSASTLQVVLLVGELDPWPWTKKENSLTFGQALESHGTDVEVVVVPNSGHSDILAATTYGGKAVLAVISDLIANAP